MMVTIKCTRGNQYKLNASLLLLNSSSNKMLYCQFNKYNRIIPFLSDFRQILPV